jgi:hypothetical protein
MLNEFGRWVVSGARRASPFAHAAAVAVVTLIVGVTISRYAGQAQTWSWLVMGIVSVIAGFLAWRATQSLSRPAIISGRSVPPQEIDVAENMSAVRTSLGMRVTVHSNVYSFKSPSSEIGPEPLYVPATGHSMLLEVTCLRAGELVVRELQAVVAERKQISFDGVSVSTPPGSGIILSEDLVEPVERARAAFRPVALPEFEILLDATPPLVRPALGPSGEPVRPTPELPIKLAVGDYASFTLAPITGDPRMVLWDINVVWDCDGLHTRSAWRCTVTGSTGFRTFHPGGKAPTETPINHVSPDHWIVRYPPLEGADAQDWQPGRHDPPFFEVHAHGAPDHVMGDATGRMWKVTADEGVTLSEPVDRPEDDQRDA